MKIYNYSALNNNHYLKGQLKAKNIKKALAQLESEGFLVVNISPEKKMFWYNFFDYSTVSRLDKINFTRHLHSFLEAGISLSQAIKIAAAQTTNKKLKFILTDVHQQIIAGHPLHDSLSKYSKYFSRYFIKLIKVGEESGKLDDVLKHLLEQQEKEHELLTNVRGSLIYPIILISATLVMITFMMIFVIPSITAILAEYETTLPLPTRIIVFVSNIFINYGIFLALGLVLFVILFKIALKNDRPKWYWEKFLMHLPLIKKVLIEYQLAFLTRAIATPLISGLTIDKSLELAAETTNNAHFKKSLLAAVKFVRRGVPLSEILKGYHQFYPPGMVGLVEIGEKTGKTDEMFGRLSHFYEKSVFNVFKNISSVIEPFMLLIIGFVVGLIALAVFTPIWRMADTIK